MLLLSLLLGGVLTSPGPGSAGTAKHRFAKPEQAAVARNFNIKMLKHPEINAMDERRSTQRFPLDNLYFVEISFMDSVTATCMLLNLSRGGAMLNLPGTMPKPLPVAGESFTVVSGPDVFSGVLEGHKGSIVWIKDTLCGIGFDEPLDREWETEFG